MAIYNRDNINYASLLQNTVTNFNRARDNERADNRERNQYIEKAIMEVGKGIGQRIDENKRENTINGENIAELEAELGKLQTELAQINSELGGMQ